MTEQFTRIPGPDGNGIYGVLRTTGNRKLVVHVHGLTHQAGSLLGVTSGEFFNARGFDHYRMSLYDLPAVSRKLNTSTLTTHVRDTESVLAHFRGDYDAVYMTGHSLGGLSALIANPEGLRAISFWDPSLDVTNFWATGPYLTYMPEYREYKLDYGNIFVLGEAMVEEIKKYPDAKCLELASKMQTPAQFVIPELSIFLASPHTSPGNYAKAFKGPFDLTYIENGDHIFSRDGNREALFEATLRWFNENG
jgi:esterase/lipase